MASRREHHRPASSADRHGAKATPPDRPVQANSGREAWAPAGEALTGSPIAPSQQAVRGYAPRHVLGSERVIEYSGAAAALAAAVWAARCWMRRRSATAS